MNRRIPRAALLLLLAAGLIGPAFAQSPTGAVHGRVFGQDKKPLTAATVTIQGPALLGMEVFMTPPTGSFHFPDLPPGVYELRAEMPGFKAQVRPGLVVDAGRSVTLSIALVPSEAEEDVVVTESSPTVDVRSAKTSVVFRRSLLAALPLNRDLEAIERLAPASVREEGSWDGAISILGATVRGQRVRLDGGAAADPATTYPAANFNPDVFEEVEFAMGGLPAEVGLTEANLVNIVTRSGRNVMDGSLTYYYSGTALNQDLFSAADIKGFAVAPSERYNGYHDFSLNIGGAVWEDRGWYFLDFRRLTWDKTNPFDPETRLTQIGISSSHFDLGDREWAGSLRVDVHPINKLRYSGLFELGHIFQPYDARSLAANASADYVPVRDGDNYLVTTHQIAYDFSQNSAVVFRGSYAQRTIPLISRTAGQYTEFDNASQVFWGAAPFNEVSKRTTYGGSLVITSYQDGWLGADHEIKFGVEYEQGESHLDWYRSNPYYSLWNNRALGDPYIVDPLNAVGRLRLTPAPTDPGQWDIQDNSRNVAAFLQDSLKAGRLALSLGLRFDYSTHYEPQTPRPSLTYTYGPENLSPDLAVGDLLTALIAQYQADYTVSPFDALATLYSTAAQFFTFSPRIGAVYDLFGDGKTALKLSFSRTFEPLWSDRYNAAQPFSPQTVDWDWHDLNRNGYMDLPGVDQYILASARNQGTTVSYFSYTDAAGVSHSLKAPYADEFTAGLEHELFRDFNLGLRFLYRKSSNLVEDIDAVNGYDATAKDEKGLIWLPLTVTDPGRDGALGTSDDKPITVYGLRADRPAPLLKGTNPAGATRKYWALLFTFDKRMSDRWQLSGSVVYGSLKGNVGADAFSTIGRTTMYNDPNSLLNAYGPLSFDRPLQIRVMGSYILPLDFVLSASYMHLSGAPYGRTLNVYFPANYMGFGTRSPFYTVRAEADGVGRYPDFDDLDLRLERSFPVGGTKKLSVYVDVFNALGGSGIFRSLDPNGILRADLAVPTYTPGPSFSQVFSVYGVRSIRLGARYSF